MHSAVSLLSVNKGAEQICTGTHRDGGLCSLYPVRLSALSQGLLPKGFLMLKAIPPQIALVDDDRDLSMALAMVLEAEGYLVQCHPDGQAALDAFHQRLPDLALFDIKMPRMDGLDLLQRLRERSDLPVIFLTGKDEELDEVLGLRMGADDYLRKPCSARVLVERIRTLLRRETARKSRPPAQKVLARGPLYLDAARHYLRWREQEVVLTVTEFLLFEALVQYPGFVKSREQLLNIAYDERVYVDDRTIDSHIKRVRRKFREVDPKFDAIETLYGAGYRFSEE